MPNLEKFTQNKKILLLSYDQGFEVGPKSLNNWSVNYNNIFQLVNNTKLKGIVLTKGYAEVYSSKYRLRHLFMIQHKPMIVKINSHSGLNKQSFVNMANCSFEYALELGTSAIGYTIYPGSKDEHIMFEQAGIVQELCRQHSLPFLLWVYPKSTDENFEERDITSIAHAANIGMHLGADAIKIKLPKFEDSMSEDNKLNILSQIISFGKPAKILFAGGVKEDEASFLSNCRLLRAAGADGMIVGRNLFTAKNPFEITEKLTDIWLKP